MADKHIRYRDKNNAAKEARIGKKGVYGRRILTNKIDIIGGIMYNTYLHATKGFRKRRVIG